MKRECSFNQWYPTFSKEALEACIVPIPNQVMEYLEHGSFCLPLEATEGLMCQGSRWSDGSSVLHEEDAQTTDEPGQPTFPEFSEQIQDVLREYGTVFIKLNWSAPLDAAWVAPTKSLRCQTLEDIYLLLKSSDRVATDVSNLELLRNSQNDLRPHLVLKKWREINPCTEFRCFVIQGKLVGICQRDLSQYYRYIEMQKYDIRQDINTLFNERVKKGFVLLKNYTFDVIRYKKDRVKIIDFGPYDSHATKTLLFTNEELSGPISDPPEFRFIGENIAIQPNDAGHFCLPREINEFYSSSTSTSAMEIIQQEVRNQDEES